MQSPNPNSSKNSTASPKETDQSIKSSKGPLEELKMDKNEIGRGDSKAVAMKSTMAEEMGVDQPIKSSKGTMEELNVDKNEIGRGDSKAVATKSSMAEEMGVDQPIKSSKGPMEEPKVDKNEIGRGDSKAVGVDQPIKSSKGPMEEPKVDKNEIGRGDSKAVGVDQPIKSSKGPMEELKVDKNEIGRGDSKAMATKSSMAEEMGVGLNDGQAIQLKKRKNNIEMKIIVPTKYPNPICPMCKGEFLTCNAAIEHMPNCVSSGTSKALQSDLNKGANEVQQMEIEGSSNAAVAAEQRKGYGFDLNELPPLDEDEI